MFGGLKNLKLVHNFTGLVFAISLVLAIRMWWKEAGVFVFPEDLEWIKAAGGYLWHVDNVPETGKYNPGQKMFFLAVAASGVIMIVTGLIMWFPAALPVGIGALDVSAACPGLCGDLRVLLRSPVPGDHR